METTVTEMLAQLDETSAAEISKKHSGKYITHYYKKAKSHEESGKMKGDFAYYYLKLLTQDKGKFYEKEERKVETMQKQADKERHARNKIKRQLEELKNKEQMKTDEFQKAKVLFRELSEIEQERRIKREQKLKPKNSFNQSRDAAVMTFYNA